MIERGTAASILSAAGFARGVFFLSAVQLLIGQCLDQQWLPLRASFRSIPLDHGLYPKVFAVSLNAQPTSTSPRPARSVEGPLPPSNASLMAYPPAKAYKALLYGSETFTYLHAHAMHRTTKFTESG